MTAPNPLCFHLSASSVAAFKACPQRFRLAYREGLRVALDTESQRVGTNWHSIHEVYQNALIEHGHKLGVSSTINEGIEAVALQAVVDHLNERYEKIPNGVTPQEWDLERQILLTSFVGYLWYYADDKIEYLQQEIPFSLPLHSPRTGLPLPETEVLRVGKIDHIIRWQGMVGVLERKSTTRSIEPDSDYWDKSKKDTQVSMYALAMRDLNTVIGLPHNIPFPGERYGNTLYDVWRRPLTKPKALTQKDTAAFMETGDYFGQKFHATARPATHPTDPSMVYAAVQVDAADAEVEGGKKSYAIRETAGMYAARLLAEIQETPTKFFQRREIARTDADLAKFRRELYNVYQAQKTMDRTGGWFENESQCRATFPCPFIPVCYGPGAEAVSDGQTIPPGYKRIFVDLTKDGQPIGDPE